MEAGQEPDVTVLVPLPHGTQGGVIDLFNVFIRYNTPLPSSAAVERMFFTGGDILRAKRSSLASYRFEHLVFLKGNFRHFGME